MKKLAVIIEDDVSVAKQLKKILEMSWFSVEHHPDAEDFLLARKTFKRCLYLIDLNLPGIGGKDMINLVRMNDKLSPIFIISGSVDDKRITEVLKNGADDYILKPFNPDHLLIKLMNSYNKLERIYNDQMSVGIKLIPEADLILREGKALKLTSKEYSILEQLLNDKTKVHHRDELISTIGSREITSRTIDVHISVLRKKLEAIFLEIETVRGQGYRIIVKEPKLALN